MRIGLDYAWHGDLQPSVWRAAGYSFAGRYFGGSAGKQLTKPEAVLLGAAGIELFVFFERGTGDYLGGYAGGKGAATMAAYYASMVGMPPGRPVYFTIDAPATVKDVMPYFDGINMVRPPSAVGVYGSDEIVAGIMRAGNAEFGCQARAWSAGAWYPGAQLRQVGSTYSGGGLTDADIEQAWADDFGQWLPVGVTPAPPQLTGDDMTDAQFTELLTQLHTAEVDSSFRQSILVALAAGNYDQAAALNDEATGKGIVTGLPAGWKHLPSLPT